MHDHLTTAGWIFLIGGWSAIVALNVWCFHQIFRERREEIVDPLTTDDRDGA
jgi:hypothetical protein